MSKKKPSKFYKVETYATHFHGHTFRVNSPDDLDAELQPWLREAYTVGAQKHLKKALAR